jgi:hypothetical protein
MNKDRTSSTSFSTGLDIPERSNRRIAQLLLKTTSQKERLYDYFLFTTRCPQVGQYLGCGFVNPSFVMPCSFSLV